MFSAERSRRAASEAALRECHITDLKAAALRQRLQQDEKHELSVKVGAGGGTADSWLERHITPLLLTNDNR